MKPSVTDLRTALAVPGLAALGGAAVVFSEFDDAPVGLLVGLLLIVAAVALNLRVYGWPRDVERWPGRTGGAIRALVA